VIESLLYLHIHNEPTSVHESDVQVDDLLGSGASTESARLLKRCAAPAEPFSWRSVRPLVYPHLARKIERFVRIGHWRRSAP